MTDEKQRYKVKDGYSFIYLTEVKDRDGHIKNFIGEEPSLAGSIIDIDPAQAIGQEHKLERVDAVEMRCNNSTCGKKFNTTVFNLDYAWCPHCGGRGGVLLGAAKVPRPKPEPKPEPEPEADKDEEDTLVVETPADEENDREEKTPQRGRKKKAGKRKK